MRRHSNLTASLIGMAGVALALIAVEAAVRLSVKTRLITPRRVETVYTPDLCRHGPPYGYELIPNRRVRAVQTINGTMAFETEYTIDAQGWRVTPVESRAGRERFIALFGGSFVFGEGLADNETLPYHLGQAARGHMPYNYGCPGYGPQQTLLRLERESLRETIDEPVGVGIFVFIHEHIRYAVGTMRVCGMWGSEFPYYRLDGDRVTYRGSFREGRPLLSRLYPLVYRSVALQYFNLDWPLRMGKRHADRTAAIIAEIGARFSEQFPGSAFHVVIYPGMFEEGNPELLHGLESRGVSYIDYEHLLDEVKWPRTLPGGQPTTQAHQAVARRLAGDLSIAVEPGPAGVKAP
ncbi:MAG: hypothetical protein GWP08_10610 [Nitrospiraceae bacterium]|nr:hypothetical protein [Nitrospiraceae bacterium]